MYFLFLSLIPHLSFQGLAVIGIIACAAAQDDASDDDIDETLLARSNAAAGWGIFLCFLAFLTEIIIIVMRFLNFGFVQNHLTISLVVVSCFSGVVNFVHVCGSLDVNI